MSGGSRRHVGGGSGAAVKPKKGGREGREPLHTLYVPPSVRIDNAFPAFGSFVVPSPRTANTLRRFESDGSLFWRITHSTIRA